MNICINNKKVEDIKITDNTEHDFGDIKGKLEDENCAFVDKDIDDVNELLQRGLIEHFDEFKKKLKKINENYDPNKCMLCLV